jgi:2',3'-cyclic-nucleotide 2'-phosphodiesterase (5'-nucleotidase family)
MKKRLLFTILCWIALSLPVSAAQKATLIYQNDVHGWLFPSSFQVGMVEMTDILMPLFEKNPNAFYALSGDLMTGPNFEPRLRGITELRLWNTFWQYFDKRGFGDRVLISPGNHDFDHGVQPSGAFSSGLLCANLLSGDNRPYYTPYRVVTSSSGLRVGFIGLLLTGDRQVLKTVNRSHLKLVPMLEAVKDVIPKMGKLDLTVLMVHEYLHHIVKLAETLPPDLGVDIILSGHNHMLLEQPLLRNGIYIFQAGAMNGYYGRADVTVDNGNVISVANRIIPLIPSELAHVALKAKEQVDARQGAPVATLKQSLLGSSFPGRENSLGDFAADAYRWATGTHVGMTNSASLRKDFRVFPGESRILYEGDFRELNPFGDHLATGTLTGRQILKILEGDALRFQNQVSGIRYKVNPKNPPGGRVFDVIVGNKPLNLDARYTFTHNAYCTKPGNMAKYLHLKSGTVEWRKTDLLCHDVLTDYARHLKTIDYPSEGAGRIEVIHQ